MLLQCIVDYEAYWWQIYAGIAFFSIVALLLLFLWIKDVFIKNAKEFEDAPKEVSKTDLVDEFIKSNCDECEHEPTNIKVGITHYSTEEGARARCEALYKRHNVNAEITFYFANQPPVKCYALDIWDFNK